MPPGGKFQRRLRRGRFGRSWPACEGSPVPGGCSCNRRFESSPFMLFATAERCWACPSAIYRLDGKAGSLGWKHLGTTAPGMSVMSNSWETFSSSRQSTAQRLSRKQTHQLKHHQHQLANASSIPTPDMSIMSISWQTFSSSSVLRLDAAACACSMSWGALQHNDTQ